MSKKWILAAMPALLWSSGCTTRLKEGSMGPDPAAGAGGLPVRFVNPPYRALDTVPVTGQGPLPAPYPLRAAAPR